MRGRFGRRRTRGSKPEGAAIEAHWLDRIREAGLVPVPALEPLSIDDVPDSFALVARGSAEDGTAWLVTFSPTSGGDALLAGVAAVTRLARDEAFGGRAVAVSPVWRAADRRRLAALAALPVGLRALPLAGDGEPGVEPESAAPSLVPVERVGAQLPAPADRDVFERALEGLRGLAAKHGGAVRGAGRSAELAILARRVAALHADEGPRLETFLPTRSSVRLDEANLSEALDRLEGYVRKRLNERRVRDGEEGLRGRALPGLRRAAELRFAEPWPMGGADLDCLDLAGVAADGTPVVGAIRERLDLAALGEILDGVLALDGVLPALLARAEPPVRILRPQLLLAARETAASVDDALSGLALDASLFDLREAAGALELVARGSRGAGVAAAVVPAVEAPAASGRRESGGEARAARGERGRGRGRERAAPDEGAVGGEEGERRERDGRRGSRGGRRRRGRGRGRGTAAAVAAEDVDGPAESGFEEVSLFDLADEGGGDAEESRGDDAPRGRSRRRGRRRGRRSGEASSEARSEGAPEGRDDLEDGDELPALAPEAPELEEDVESSYDAEELQEEPLTAAERIRLERERRRLARVAKTGPDTPEPPEAPEGEVEPEEVELRLPRGRAAILALADRESIAAAVLLAREVRNIEGLWVYPQEELMTFFRSVCTDLRENTPIYVVGFVARPARDALQAAALYRDRLVWFDHHDWPPEDLGALRDAIGEPMVHVVEGCGSSLPLALAQCTRRSRFTDKLVDLVTGRFTQHDFERWGRLWWSRLGAMAERPGDHRADVEMLLAGRPSDLAKEAARLPAPPPPDEVAWVAERDFRLVHFGGFVLVVADVPGHLSLNLVSRVMRERYGAAISLARSEGGDVFVLGADEVTGRRAIDAGAMVDHLDAKFAWVEALPQADHVARFRADVAEAPERLDELVSEIAMGRSILEG